ncbi:MAG TPA: valine--tRNA ligase [Acidimicrobiales bacterium]|nr:valine--tRNA ligase [Acidimicrobiales bacterium]
MDTPERPTLEGLEDKWGAAWEASRTYEFDRSASREDVYSIDNPPPTVSGTLHVGHIFSYTQPDIFARFWRMRGKAVFYPIGWDDNGLPTERRVQNFFGVRCDPSLPYDPSFQPPAEPPKPAIGISRKNFVELCNRLTEEDERAFEQLFRRLGLSVDWSHHYTTIGEAAQRAAQRAFLRELGRGEVYRAEAPTLWDVDFRSAIAQAELKDKEIGGAYHRIRFGSVATGGTLEIDTTRPELIPACVALVAHPEDERYKPLFGTEAVTPLFGVRVPIHPHRLADPEKGTGIAMVCTFGDLTDVLWWRELRLATRTLVGRDGRMREAAFGGEGWESEDAGAANARYGEIEGLTVKQAQKKVVELLTESGDLLGEPKPITHPVKFYEYGERPLEIVSSPQWYVRTTDRADALLARGRQLAWHPGFMQARYESWVEGLTGDWNISRQRFFGVPFPVWYAVGEDGEVDHETLLLASEERLPVDPSIDVPDGCSEDQRGKPRGFVADPDVMDTWATSSLSPQIAGRWETDPDLFSRVFPMDLRPQAHEIIRTWLFSTVVRAELEHDSLPFRHAAISGWILDPDRKKMSKSSGTVVVPNDVLDSFGVDAVRYWAASARLGVDTAYDEQQMKIGRRLAIKLLNVSRFVLSRLDEKDVAAAASGQAPAAGLTPLDASMLAGLAEVAAVATAAFEDYDYARALDLTETFFWTYCDDYVELVKTRAYGDTDEPGTISARVALAVSLSTLLRLFAPFLPYVTEEAWSWWHADSIHLAPWPDAPGLSELAGPDAQPQVLPTAGAVLGEIRAAKTTAKQSMRARIERCTVAGPAPIMALVALSRDDLVDAGGIDDLDLSGEAEALTVTAKVAI